MTFAFLSASEAEATERALQAIKAEEWAAPLFQRIKEGGGIVHSNQPLLFEARFAHSLHLKGVKPKYEFPAGVGGSTVDFALDVSRKWLVELVSIGISAGAISATHETERGWSRVLTTPGFSSKKNPKESTEHEMLLVEGKIGAKVFRNGAPTKFPEPTDALHMIVVDMRGYLDGHHDWDDLAQISFGAQGVLTKAFVVNWVNPKSGKPEPIKGLFEPTNPLSSSKYIRERVHFLAFVAERRYTTTEIEEKIKYFCNPFLVSSADACSLLGTFPLARIKRN